MRKKKSSFVNKPGEHFSGPEKAAATLVPKKQKANRRLASLDALKNGHVSGWAKLPDHDQSLYIDVDVNDRCVVKKHFADVYREDLEKAGFGHGRYGFLVSLEDVSDIQGDTVTITIRESGKPEILVSKVFDNIFRPASVLSEPPVVPPATLPESSSAPPTKQLISRPRKQRFGSLDALKQRRVSGWIKHPDHEQSVQIDIYINDFCAVPNYLANEYREDLEKAGFGHGRYGFLVPLQDVPEIYEDTVTISIREAGKPEVLVSKVFKNIFKTTFAFETQSPPVPVTSDVIDSIEQSVLLQKKRHCAFIDEIKRGHITGWAKREDSDLSLHIDVYVNDFCVIKNHLADRYRGDVEKAGFGHGCYGFIVPLMDVPDIQEDTVRIFIRESGKPEVLASKVFKNIFKEKQTVSLNFISEDVKFDEKHYTALYQDLVATYSGSSREHYLEYGKNEGKLPFPVKPEQIVSLSEIAPIDYIKNASVAIHMHVSHIEMLDSILIYLKNIPFKFSLFISVNADNDVSVCYQKMSQLSMLQNVDVCVVPNRGRSILPFVKFLQETLIYFDYVCHIHTKKDRDGLYGWKSYLLEKLLGSENTVRKCFTLLTQKQCGLVFPEPYFLLSERTFSFKKFIDKFNLNLRASFFSRFNLPVSAEANYFPSGSMFWCKPSALTRLLNANLDDSDFQEDIEDDKRVTAVDLIERLIAISTTHDQLCNFVILNDSNYGDLSVPAIPQHTYKSYVKNFIAKYLFDPEYYCEMYLDVAKTKTDPLRHYQSFGIDEQRCACPHIPVKILKTIISQHKKIPLPDSFDLLWYLSSYYKIGETFIFSDFNPYEHYIKAGRDEGKQPNNFTYSNWLKNNPDLCQQSGDIKVSIIIPVYESAKYLFGCVTSAISQTLKDVEIIIINDGSTDNSSQIIDTFLKQNSNITCITHEQNCGLVMTHNDGINRARGKYFTILDGDDWLDKKFCEIMYATAEAYDAELVCCVGARVFVKKSEDRDHSVLVNLHVLEDENLEKALGASGRNQAKIHYGLNRKIHRTDTWRKLDPLKNVDPSLILAEDHVATMRFCQSIQRAVYIENHLYNWYVNMASVSNRDRTKKDIQDYFCSLKSSASACINKSSISYLQNLRSLFVYELLSSLRILSSKNPDATLELLDYVAEEVDRNRHLFTDEFFLEMKQAYSALYLRLYGEKSTKNDFIVFVDPDAIHDIRDYVLPYWNSNIPTKYISIDYRKPFVEGLQDIRDAMSARLVVASGGWNKQFFDTNSPILQLWHGMGALKKVPVSKPLSIKKIYISSPDVAFAYERLFSLQHSQIVPYGTIQSDYFLDDAVIDSYKDRFYLKYPELKEKTIYLWCPTFRNSAEGYAQAPLFDLQKFDQQLDKDEVFLYKLHPVLFQNTENNLYCDQLFSGFTSCRNFSNEDLRELIAVADVFMTDYSSTIFYAMLRYVPIVIYASDLKQYKANPGLEIDIESDIPGSVITVPDAGKVLTALRNASSDTEAYHRFRHFHLGACDGMSKERIFSDIKLTYFEEMKK